MINYMPEISDIITTDYDHHVAGTAAIAADKASYAANRIISNLYNELYKELKDKNVIDLDALDEELRLYRRGYLSQVRDIMTWVSTAHMLAIPPYRRIIGTDLKMTALMAIAGLLHDEIPDADKDENETNKKYEELIDSLAEYLWSLAETIHKLYETYHELATNKNKYSPLTLTYPGNLLPRDCTITFITEYLNKQTTPNKIIQKLLKTNMNIKNKQDFKNKLTLILNLQKKLVIATYLTKYKLKGAILGLAATLIKILEDLKIRIKENNSEDNEKPKNIYNLKDLTYNKIIEILSYILKTYEAFIVSISIPPSPPIIIDTIEHNINSESLLEITVNLLSNYVSPDPDIFINIPCCLINITSIDSIQKISNELDTLLYNVLYTDEEFKQNNIQSNNNCDNLDNRIIKDLFRSYFDITYEPYKIKFIRIYPYLYNIDFPLIESESIPSAFILDILNKLYEDIWSGIHVSMIDIQHLALDIDDRTKNIFNLYRSNSINIISAVLSNISNITKQYIKYNELKENIIKKVLNNEIRFYAILYYKSLLYTLEDLHDTLNDTLDIIYKYESNLQDNLTEKLIKIIIELSKQVLNLISKFKLFIRKLLDYLNIIIYNENNKYIELKDLKLDLIKFNDYTFNKIIFNNSISKDNSLHRYRSVMLDSKYIASLSIIISILKYNKLHNNKTNNYLYNNILEYNNKINEYNNKLLEIFTLYRPRLKKSNSSDSSIDSYISKIIGDLVKIKINNIDKNNNIIHCNFKIHDIDIKLYIPIRGIIKLFYHNIDRPKSHSNLFDYNRLISTDTPFTIFVIYDINANSECSDVNYSELYSYLDRVVAESAYYVLAMLLYEIDRKTKEGLDSG